MMDHPHDQHITEERMHPRYRQAEQRFREEAGKLWTEEEATRARLRAAGDMPAEQRLDVYRARYGELQRRYEALVEKFSAEVSASVRDATQTLNRGTGASFGTHLATVSQIPDEKLGEVQATARRSGQEDLEHAIALVAYERGLRPVWQSWAESNPKRAEAVRVLRSVPGAQQFEVRTRALRPPRAEEVDIEPTAADVEAQRRKAEEAQSARRSFFASAAGGNAPRRQVGRRTA